MNHNCSMNLAYVIAFCTIYSLVYAVLAINVVGLEGRGPLIFISPFRPFGLPWILLILAIFISRRLLSFESRLIWVLLMVGHYGISLMYVFPYFWEGTPEAAALSRVMVRRPDAIYLTVVWYAAGQIVVWSMFAKAIRRN